MSLTCISCKVVFASADVQREHYKDDWHRYNLKRKIAELPPVTKEEFDIRAAAHTAPSSAVENIPTCEICHKKFVSHNSFLNHVKSKKHLENETRQKTKTESKTKIFSTPKTCEEKIRNVEMTVDSEGEWDENDSDWESCDDDEDDKSIPPNFCLFCSLESKSVEENVKHMTEAHSFFIPDIEYLVDLKGLITYLGHKIGNGYMCLWCDEKGKSFYSVKSVQQHMLDKGHCKILHEGKALINYADFYDYSSSYPDVTEENGDDEIPIHQLQTEDYELVLPSGAVIGHRSLALYYRQNLRPRRPERSQALSNVMQHYRALGWTGTSGEAAIRKAKDLKFLQRLKSKHYLKLGFKQNKYKPHFRSQVMF